jgi:hypothetical protein
MIKLTIVAGLFVVGLLILSGLYLFLKGVRNVQRSLASTKWPVAEGIVVHSETTRTVTKSTRRTAASVSFSTNTVIRYAVGDKEYTTNVLHFGQTLGSDDKSEAALLHLRYPEGKKVSVSYNPGAPWVGVMKPGLHPEAFWLPGASLALLLPAAICLMIGPSIVRDMGAGGNAADRAFEESVHQAIEDAKRGVTPVDAPMPPPDTSGDRTMAFVAVAFGALACGLGVLALTAGLQRLWRGEASRSWPTTSGVVIVASKGNTDDEDTVNDTTDIAWYARFVYQYRVAGADHYNNVRRFAQVEGGGGSEAAEKIATRYRQGAKVTVSYFPTDPDVAVLEPGNTSAALWMPGLGVVMILFSTAVFIWIVPAVMKP